MNDVQRLILKNTYLFSIIFILSQTSETKWNWGDANLS